MDQVDDGYGHDWDLASLEVLLDCLDFVIENLTIEYGVSSNETYGCIDQKTTDEKQY